MTDAEMSGGQISDAEVLFDKRGRLGLITLNRPQAINALTHSMVRQILAALDGWEHDPQVAAVAITGAGERGLCAGGDIVSLYRDATEGDGHASAAFWRDEYTLNLRIANYPKPYVAIQDGIVLGGGIGLSAHGSHRIVTERSKLGLPEVGIGFIPDIGATWLLAHAPGELGTYLALTGGSVGAADAIHLGLADFCVPSDRLGELLTALETEAPDVAISQVSAGAGRAALAEQAEWIDPAFAGSTVRGILNRLRAITLADARATADTMEAKSPIALAVALESLRRARALPSLAAVLDQEYRVSLHALASHDFAEGIRAQVVDKDRQPRWQPAALNAVDEGAVEAYFAPVDHELGLSATADASPTMRRQS
ncbi:enoyl-CoA hydratase/isomerase family protein [Diaminobutyricimonas sp. LJ205]|uniref:enoyl-CoA hydratase/isomerase family protein n=1 Tax=Diaminobutyricimonas sp. LJ205 TaxID=2683590 RepID=UPI001E5BC06D|nr:enoyl-CoA hydratase/isomerase family protein [Diaminobutyricimonas sp. LJ205]